MAVFLTSGIEPLGLKKNRNSNNKNPPEFTEQGRVVLH